jgi:hypothetical protein
MPTILDALGHKAPDAAQGETLIPLAQGVGRGYPRPSFASNQEFAWAMRLHGWKLKVGNDTSLHYMPDDPDEKKDLLQARHTERRFMTDAMSLFLVNQQAWQKSRWGVPSNMLPQAADEIR